MSKESLLLKLLLERTPFVLKMEEIEHIKLSSTYNYQLHKTTKYLNDLATQTCDVWIIFACRLTKNILVCVKFEQNDARSLDDHNLFSSC